jgi:methyl-accepting chemotaxis protein
MKKIHLFHHFLLAMLLHTTISYGSEKALNHDPEKHSNPPSLSYYIPSPTVLITTGLAIYIYRGNLWATGKHLYHALNSLENTVRAALASMRDMLATANKETEEKINAINKTAKTNTQNLHTFKEKIQDESRLLLRRFETVAALLKQQQNSNTATAEHLNYCATIINNIDEDIPHQQKLINEGKKTIEQYKKNSNDNSATMSNLVIDVTRQQKQLEGIENRTIKLHNHIQPHALPSCFVRPKLMLKNNNQEK